MGREGEWGWGGRHGRYLNKSICLPSVGQDGAFSCLLADCRGEMWAAQVLAGPSKAKARLALIRGEGPACPRRCYLHLPSWAPLVFGRVDKSREVY